MTDQIMQYEKPTTFLVAQRFSPGLEYLGLSIFIGGTNVVAVEAGADFYVMHALTDADIERLGEMIHQHKERKLTDPLPPIPTHYIHTLAVVQRICHHRSLAAGWWKNDQAVINAVPADLQKYAKALVVLAKLDLQHSELSEATEGYRKDLMDDHLPHRPMIEVELADALIRIFDLAGWLGLDVSGALIEKLAYNQSRPDHKEENREKTGGKTI